LLSSTIPPLLTTPKELHQHLMVAYQMLDSSNDAKLLYSKQCAKCQVPILQLQFNQLFYVLIYRLCPMKITSVFLVIHSHSCGIIWAIDNTSIILICLRIIYHKPFKMELTNAIPCHNFIQFCPHDALNICVLWLHVTCSNGHHFIVHWVVDMVYFSTWCGQT
jgi:hypothetical protein